MYINDTISPAAIDSNEYVASDFTETTLIGTIIPYIVGTNTSTSDTIFTINNDQYTIVEKSWFESIKENQDKLFYKIQDMEIILEKYKRLVRIKEIKIKL